MYVRQDTYSTHSTSTFTVPRYVFIISVRRLKTNIVTTARVWTLRKQNFTLPFSYAIRHPQVGSEGWL